MLAALTKDLQENTRGQQRGRTKTALEEEL